MIKRILPIILCLGFMFSITAMAENETGSGAPNGASQENSVTDVERPGGRNRGFQPSQGEFTPQNNMQDINGNQQQENSTDITGIPENNTQAPGQNRQQERQFPGNMQGGFSGEAQSSNQAAEAEQSAGFIGFVKTYSTPITSVVLLALAFIFVIVYKRKSY